MKENDTYKTPPLCPLTETEKTHHIMDVKDYGVSGESFSVFENTEMPFRFTFPVPEAEEIHTYYDSETYLSHDDSADGLIARLFRISRLYTMNLKRRLVSKYSSGTEQKLLDFGCGTGDFAFHMKKAGWTVKGIEPSHKAAEIAESKYAVEVYESLKSIPASGKFDVITAWHVIEHVHELHQTMESFYEKLNDNGTLIIAVPNYLSFDASFYKEMWAGYDVPRHLYHFSPESLKYLAHKHNFERVARKRMWLDAFYVSLLSESYLKTGFAGYPGAFIVGLWSNFLALFNKNKCSALTFILRKRNTP